MRILRKGYSTCFLLPDDNNHGDWTGRWPTRLSEVSAFDAFNPSMPKNAAQRKPTQAPVLNLQTDEQAASTGAASRNDEQDTALLPLAATPCVRIRYGDRQSKVAAQMLVVKIQEEFGDEVRVVLRRNHDDEDSPRVLLGLDFFGVSMQLSEPVLWSGEPADVEQKEWMDPAVCNTRATSACTCSSLDLERIRVPATAGLR